MTAFLLATMLFIGEREVQAERPAPEASKPTLTLPPQVQAKPGEFFEVPLTTTCKWVRWTIPPGLRRVPTKYTGDKVFVGDGPAGVYEFKVEGTLNDQFAESKCVVFVGQPTPGPIPPPGPSPDVPDEPLFARLQGHYTANQSPLKAVYRDKLIAAYEFGIDKARDTTDDEIKTTGQLFTAIRELSEKIVKNELPKVRAELVEVCAEFKGMDRPLDAGTRAKAVQCFERCIKLLKALR